MPYSGKFVPILAHLAFFDWLRRNANPCIMEAPYTVFRKGVDDSHMKKVKTVRRPLYWLLPLLFALPLLAGGAYAAYCYVPKIKPLLEVALKVVLIP